MHVQAVIPDHIRTHIYWMIRVFIVVPNLTPCILTLQVYYILVPLLLICTFSDDLNLALSHQSVLRCIQIRVEVIVLMFNDGACHKMFRVYFHRLFLCFYGSLDRITYPIEH